MNLELAKRRSLVGWSGTAGAYVSVQPTPNSRILLTRVAKDLKLPTSVDDVFDYHCTVVWSKQTPKLIAPSSSKMFRAVIKGLDYWMGHDSDGYIVVLLDSPDLQQRSAFWRSLGAVHSFEDYTPHVTLCSKLTFSPELRDGLTYCKSKYVGSELNFTSETCVDAQ